MFLPEVGTSLGGRNSQPIDSKDLFLPFLPFLPKTLRSTDETLDLLRRFEMLYFGGNSRNSRNNRLVQISGRTHGCRWVLDRAHPARRAADDV